MIVTQKSRRNGVFLEATINQSAGVLGLSNARYWWRGEDFPLPDWTVSFDDNTQPARLYVEKTDDGYDWMFTNVGAKPRGNGAHGEWILVAWRNRIGGEIQILEHEEITHAS